MPHALVNVLQQGLREFMATLCSWEGVQTDRRWSTQKVGSCRSLPLSWVFWCRLVPLFIMVVRFFKCLRCPERSGRLTGTSRQFWQRLEPEFPPTIMSPEHPLKTLLFLSSSNPCFSLSRLPLCFLSSRCLHFALLKFALLDFCCNILAIVLSAVAVSCRAVPRKLCISQTCQCRNLSNGLWLHQCLCIPRSSRRGWWHLLAPRLRTMPAWLLPRQSTLACDSCWSALHDVKQCSGCTALVLADDSFQTVFCFHLSALWLLWRMKVAVEFTFAYVCCSITLLRSDIVGSAWAHDLIGEVFLSWTAVWPLKFWCTRHLVF